MPVSAQAQAPATPRTRHRLAQAGLDDEHRPRYPAKSAAAEEKARRSSLEGSIIAPLGSFYAVPRIAWQRGDNPYADKPPEAFSRVDGDMWYQSLGPQWRRTPPAVAEEVEQASPAMNTRSQHAETSQDVSSSPATRSQWRRDDLMPPLDVAQAAVEANRTHGKAWQPWDPPEVEGGDSDSPRTPWKPWIPWTPRDQVEEVLCQLGECLYTPALQSWTRSRRRTVGEMTSLTPLDAMLCPFRHQCMLLSPSKIRKAQYIKATFAKDAYAKVILVKSSRGRLDCPDCTIGAHRYVCWSDHGPPPADGTAEGTWVVMHTCNNKDCINRRHLIWGKPKDNNVPFMKKRKAGSGYKR